MRFTRFGWMIFPFVMFWGLNLTTAAKADAMLLDFYADWCKPCQTMTPAVDALSRDGYSVQRINIDRDRALAQTFNVTAIPCFVIVEQGKEVDRIVGATTAEQLRMKLQRQPAVVTANGNQKQPRPAWRYEKPVGHRAAVVRVYSVDGRNARSIGSGVLVRWGKRVAVLTARHVIQDARRIRVEMHDKHVHSARVLKVDPVWDCAVLELDHPFDDTVAADIELGDEAMQQKGNRLESCGYGPDGKLACNSGLFLGYRRSSQAPNGPDDWMEISGHARGGDSGGPIFNEKGRVVGVLWGSDGQRIVGVQAGRIHLLLDEAMPQVVEQKAFILLGIFERKPTPPRAGPSLRVQPTAPRASTAPQGNAIHQESLGQIVGRKPIPQTPQVIVQSDPEVRQSLGSIDAKVGSLVQDRQAQQQAAAENAKTQSAKESEEASPLVAGLCILVAIAAGFVAYFATQK